MPMQYFQNTRPEMMQLVPPMPGRVLEIGCGEGQFAAGILGAHEVWGIEPHVPSAAIAATRLTRVLPAMFDLAEADLPKGGFDLIVCNDVIEHMDDHDGFLVRIADYLAPGGVLIGSVPNVRYFRNLFHLLVVQDWHYQDDGVLDRTHKRFFTLKSLRRSLEAAGYRVREMHGINPKLTWDFSRGNKRYALFGFGCVALSLGTWRDISFMQLAFSVQRAA